jgi:hypothetical protein
MLLFEKYKAAWGNVEEMAKLYHDDVENESRLDRIHDAAHAKIALRKCPLYL